MSKAAKPKIFLMRECPFCLKLRIFLSEASLDGEVEYVTFASGDSTHQSVRDRMIEAGQKPSFPAAELQEGSLTTETDALIDHFASQAGVDPAAMPLLTYYTEGVFKRIFEMYHELAELKKKTQG